MHQLNNVESQKLPLLLNHSQLDNKSFAFFDALALRLHRDTDLADDFIEAVKQQAAQINVTQLVDVELVNLKKGRPNLKSLSQELKRFACDCLDRSLKAQGSALDATLYRNGKQVDAHLLKELVSVLKINMSVYHHDEQGEQYNTTFPSKHTLLFRYNANKNNEAYTPLVETEKIKDLQRQQEHEFQLAQNDIFIHLKEKIDGEPGVRTRAEFDHILKEYQISLAGASFENQAKLTPVHRRLITKTQQFKCALRDVENPDSHYLFDIKDEIPSLKECLEYFYEKDGQIGLTNKTGNPDNNMGYLQISYDEAQKKYVFIDNTHPKRSSIDQYSTKLVTFKDEHNCYYCLTRQEVLLQSKIKQSQLVQDYISELYLYLDEQLSRTNIQEAIKKNANDYLLGEAQSPNLQSLTYFLKQTFNKQGIEKEIPQFIQCIERLQNSKELTALQEKDLFNLFWATFHSKVSNMIYDLRLQRINAQLVYNKSAGIRDLIHVLLNTNQSQYYPELNKLVEHCLNASHYPASNDVGNFSTFFALCAKHGIVISADIRSKIMTNAGYSVFESFRARLAQFFAVDVSIKEDKLGKKECLIQGGFVCITDTLLKQINDKILAKQLQAKDVQRYVFSSGHHLGVDASLVQQEFGGAQVVLHANKDVYVCRDVEINLNGSNGINGSHGKDGKDGKDWSEHTQATPTMPGAKGLDGRDGGHGEHGVAGGQGQHGKHGGQFYLKADRLDGAQISVCANGGNGGHGGNGGDGGRGGSGGNGGNGSGGRDGLDGRSSQALPLEIFDYGDRLHIKNYKKQSYAEYQAKQEAGVGGDGGLGGKAGKEGLGGARGTGGRAGEKGIIQVELAQGDQMHHKNLFCEMRDGNSGQDGKDGIQGLALESKRDGRPGQRGATGKAAGGECAPVFKENQCWEKNTYNCPEFSLSGLAKAFGGDTVEGEIKNKLRRDYEYISIINENKSMGFLTDYYSPEILAWTPCADPRLIKQQHQHEKEDNTNKDESQEQEQTAEVQENQSDKINVQEPSSEVEQNTPLDSQELTKRFATSQDIQGLFEEDMLQGQEQLEALEQDIAFWETFQSKLISQSGNSQSIVALCAQDGLISVAAPSQRLNALAINTDKISTALATSDAISNMSMVYKMMNILHECQGSSEQNDALFAQLICIIQEQGTLADINRLHNLSKQHQLSDSIKQQIQYVAQSMYDKANAQNTTIDAQTAVMDLSGQKQFNIPDEQIAPGYFEDNELHHVWNELAEYHLEQGKINSEDQSRVLPELDELYESFGLTTKDEQMYLSEGINHLKRFGLSDEEIAIKILPALNLLMNDAGALPYREAFFFVLDAIQKLEPKALSKERKSQIYQNIQLFCLNWSSFSYEPEALARFDGIPIGVWNIPLQLDYSKRLLQAIGLKILNPVLDEKNIQDIEEEFKNDSDDSDTEDFVTSPDLDEHTDDDSIQSDSQEFLTILYSFNSLLCKVRENEPVKAGEKKLHERISNQLLVYLQRATSFEQAKNGLAFLEQHGINKICANSECWSLFIDGKKDWELSIERILYPLGKPNALTSDEIITQLRQNNALDETKQKLRIDIDRVNDLLEKNSSEYIIQDKTIRAEKIKELLNNKKYAEVVVMMCLASQEAYEKMPYDTQRIALFEFLYALESGKGLAGEISTGEGKSLITSMVVACNALLGNKVMVVTSTPALAQRDVDEAAHFYDLFGLNASNNCDKQALSSTQELKKRYKENTILYGQASDFERDRLMTESKGADLCASWMNKDVCLFVDEIDNMLINNGAFTLFLSDDVPDFQLLTPLIKDLWGAWCIKYKEINELDDEFDKESLLKEAKETVLLQFQEKLAEGEFQLTSKLTGYAKRSLSGWIDSAATALSFNLGAEYQIEPSTEESGYANVVVMDISTGVEQKSTQWMDMLHQFIQLKHNLNMTQPTVMSVYESNMSFVERFDGKVYGVTGTLGTNISKQLLCDLGCMNYFHLPRRIPSRLKNEKETVVLDKIQWKEAILQSILRKSETQPVLIVVEHAGQVAELKSYLVENGVNVKNDYDTNAKMESDSKELQSVAAKDVFIATYIAGRGTDIKFDEERLPDQGLHVILASLPDTERDYLQVIGRSGRNGHLGTCEHIVLDADMTPLSVLKFKRDFEDARSNDAVRTTEVPKNQLLKNLYQKFMALKTSISTDSCFSKLSDQRKEALQQELSARWGFFLSKITQIYSSDEVFEHSDKEETLLKKADEKLDKIKNETLAQATQIGSQKMRFFSTNMALGHEALERGNYAQAEDLFRQAAEPKTSVSSYAQYYQAISKLQQNQSITTRKEARKLIKSAGKLLEMQLSNMSRDEIKLNIINECMQFPSAAPSSKDGATKLNAALQQQNRRQALEVVSSQLKQLTGRSFSFEEADQFLKDKDTTSDTISVLQRLVNDDIIKGTRLSKKITIIEEPEVKLLLDGKEIELSNISQNDKKALCAKIKARIYDNRAINKDFFKSVITETQERVFDKLQKEGTLSNEPVYQLLSKDLSSDELKKYQCFADLLSQLERESPFTKEMLQEKLQKQLNEDKNVQPELDDSLYNVNYFISALEQKSVIRTGVQVLKPLIEYKIYKERGGLFYFYPSKLDLPENEAQGVDNLWKELLQHGVIKNYALNEQISNDDSYDTIETRIKNAKELSDFLSGVRARVYEFKEFRIKKSELQSVYNHDMNQDASKRPNSELLELAQLGFSAIYNLEKAPEPPWAAIGAMLLGVAQIVAGAVILAALSATGVGAVAGAMFARALISEGCSDITIGVTGLITGNFKWSDYKQQKLESITMTVAFAGLGAVGKGLAVLNRARKAKKLHTQAKQMICAAKAAKSLNNVKEAKAIFKQAKQLKKQGNELFKKGKSRVIHKGTDVRGMTSHFDKARHIAKYTAKKIGSAAITATGHEVINQLMQSLMERLVKNIMNDAKQQIDPNSCPDSNELKDLFAMLYETKDSERALAQFFEEQKGHSLITSLIQSENPCLSTWDSVSSGFSDLADMHSHSGGSQNKIELFNKMSQVAKHLINGVKFISSCDHISKNARNKLNSLVNHKTSLNEQEPVVPNDKEQEDKKNSFINDAMNQYHAFVAAEVLCAFEHHIIRPMLKEKCTQAVKRIVRAAYVQTDSMRAQTRLNLLAQGDKKMGHQELSHLLKKDAEYSKLLNAYGMVILKQEGEDHYVEHSEYKTPGGLSKKNKLVGLFIKDQHAVPCIQVNGKWEPVSLATTLKNACIPQSLFFAHEFSKAKQQKLSDDEAKLKAEKSACDRVKLANYRNSLVESLRNDDQYRAAYTERDFRRYRDVAKAGAKRDTKNSKLQDQPGTDKKVNVKKTIDKQSSNQAPELGRPSFFNATKINIPVSAAQDRRHILHFSDAIRKNLAQFCAVVCKQEGEDKLSKRLDSILNDLDKSKSDPSKMTIKQKKRKVLALMNSHEGNLIAGDKIYNQAIEKTRSCLEKFLNDNSEIDSIDSLRQNYNKMLAEANSGTDRTNVTHSHLKLLGDLLDNVKDYTEGLHWIVDFKNSATLDIAHDKTTIEDNISGLKNHNSIACAETILNTPCQNEASLNEVQEYLTEPFRAMSI